MIPLRLLARTCFAWCLLCCLSNVLFFFVSAFSSTLPLLTFSNAPLLLWLPCLWPLLCCFSGPDLCFSWVLKFAMFFLSFCIFYLSNLNLNYKLCEIIFPC